jgi:DNA-binding beta-propeller fold protein YncE
MMARLWLSLLVLLAVPAVRAEPIASSDIYVIDGGMAINRAGNLALVTNRADNSVSVLSISGKTVTARPPTLLRNNHPPWQLRLTANGRWWPRLWRTGSHF